MPELPEVETTCRGIKPHITGYRVSTINIRNKRLRWPIPDSIQDWIGQRIIDVSRRGKYILIRAEKGTAIIHLGMSGSLRICKKDEAYRKHDHFECQLNSGQALRLHDPRRFGAVLWTTDDPLQHPLLARLGPEPLTNTFNQSYLFQQSRKRKQSIKTLIMDSHTVVGVGNIYASESLFLAGIRPGKAAGRITQVDANHLTAAIKNVLKKAIAEGGTTLKDFINADGKPGYFSQSLNVYGREGQACHQCQTPIKQKKISQRASYYCPVCQT